MSKAFLSIKLILFSIMFSACQGPDISGLDKSLGFLKKAATDVFPDKGSSNASTVFSTEVPLNFLEDFSKTEFVDIGFRETIVSAVLRDPSVLRLHQNLKVQSAGYDVSKFQKEFRVNGTIYSGVEDVSDSTSGIALVS